MAMTTEESRAMAETIMAMQGGFSKGISKGVEEKRELTKQEFLLNKAAALGMPMQSAEVAGDKLSVKYGDETTAVYDPATGQVKYSVPKRSKPFGKVDQNNLSPDRLDLQKARESRLLAQFEDKKKRAEIAKAEKEGTATSGMYKDTFSMAQNLYNSLSSEYQREVDDDRLLILERTRRDALKSMVNAAKKAGIDIGEYEINIDPDDRSWLYKFLGKGEAPEKKVVPKNTGADISSRGDNMVSVYSPDGTPGSIPASQLNEALKQGYTER